MTFAENRRLGASYLGNGRCEFLVWAPFASSVELHLLAPQDRLVTLEKGDRNYFHAIVDSVAPGSTYLYRQNGASERPDPASRFQPNGVHGPSQVVDPGFRWTDEGWRGLPLQDYIIYELHVGTFTQEGTFNAIIPHLDSLKDLGITAVELMPVAQFPGSRNWGYDGVCPYAVQNSYGTPQDLKSLVDACHARSLAVILDVVYNHLGPEGNYLSTFGHYFTDRYRTPWGPAINFDGPFSEEVRRFFVENAICWTTDFHVDALRLDAVHAILDFSAHPFLQELAESVHHRAEQLGRRVYLIPESDLNDARLVIPKEEWGYGLDAVWSDDFHHSVHTLLTGEALGYYEDFGGLNDLVRALTDGFVYSGQYSRFRKRSHGNSSRRVPAERFVVFLQNHDQVGNRMDGDRLSRLISFEKLKLAAGILFFSPFIPLVFMGEEYGEKAPFQYYVSHSDPALIEAVRQGRRDEFASFRWIGQLSDPQDESTFQRAKLDPRLQDGGTGRVLLKFYKSMIQLRKQTPAVSQLSKERMEVVGLEKELVLFVRRWSEGSEVFGAFNFNDGRVQASLPVPEGSWRKLFDSADAEWMGKGSHVFSELRSSGEMTMDLQGSSFVLFTRGGEAGRSR